MKLLEPIDLGPRTAPNRVMFGPHVTNLGDDDRRLTRRHVAYYERRARGGCGTIVVEGASVHASDWPYERAPLAARCADGWNAVVGACRPHGPLVLASLDHAGGQGSSAYSQAPLFAPGRVPEVATRETPKMMEDDDIAAVVEGFTEAGRLAIDAGCDGVELNAGQHSLIRQFLSGLTNQRDDAWGHDRLLFARQVIEAVRRSIGDDAVLGLRLSCDELAPWAGLTPEMITDIAPRLIDAGVDHLVVVRGSIYSLSMTRPTFHHGTGVNVDLCRHVREAVSVPVVLQGSVIDVGEAEWALGGADDPALCDGVEMTRAQIADPDLVRKVADGRPSRIRPCTLCNQTCQVRDARNPLITCVGEPTSGHETEDPDWYHPARTPRRVLVVGGGPAGLETSRIAATRGHEVRLVERGGRLGGLAAVAGPHEPLIDWQVRELDRLGVHVDLDTELDPRAVEPQTVVVQCTGSVQGPAPFDVDDGAVPFVDIAEIRRGTIPVPEGTVALFDPIGGPIAIALAEELGDRAILVIRDNIPGELLSRSGDLADASVRLQQGGVRIERRAIARAVTTDGLVVEDRFSGERRTIPCDAVVDCGFRVPDDPMDLADHRAGDAVAPRTVHEAVLEGRRVGHAI
jgi:mycofactocin system FadH/OYE family oxidoreductase 1